MNKIKLLYAKNIISRKGGGVRQELSFLALVENLAFAKSIDVLWAGEDSVWRVLPAAYHRAIDEQKEYWFARTTVALADNELLPGNVLCAVRYRAAGAEYWDNNHGENYSIQADSGIRLTDGYPLLNVESESCLSDGQSVLPIVVAVESALQARKMTVHWTSDDWQSKQQTACHFRRGYWNSELLSNARNPNHYGCQVWQAVLKAGEAFQIQYRISCETRQQALLDDNFGQNYTIQRRPLTVMVLNLHCRQEDDQGRCCKGSQIFPAHGELQFCEQRGPHFATGKDRCHPPRKRGSAQAGAQPMCPRCSARRSTCPERNSATIASSKARALAERSPPKLHT